MAITREQFFDDDLMSQFPELAQTSKDMANELFGGAGLSPEEKAELAALTNRAQRLAPIDAPQMQGSTAIPGNVFSVDRSPAYNAFQQGLVKVLNSQRQKRMLEPDAGLMKKAEQSQQALDELSGDEEESNALRKALEEEIARFETEATAKSPSARLQSLTEKEEEGTQAEQMQDELMMRLFPDLVGRATSARDKLTQEETRHQNTLEEISARGEEQIKAIKTRAAEEAGGNTKSPQYAVGVITGFLGQTDPMSKSITNTISGLQQQRALVDDPSEIDQQIKDLEKKRAELQKWRSDAYKALSEGNLYDSDLIDRLDTIVGGEGVADNEPVRNRAAELFEGSNQSMFNVSGVFE